MAVDKTLAEYLTHLGLEAYVDAFPRHGVTSVPLLKRMTRSPGVKAAIKGDIRRGWGQVSGSALAADEVDRIRVDRIQNWARARAHNLPGQSAERTTADLQARRTELAAALTEVRSARERIEQATTELSGRQRAEVQAALDKVNARLADEGLGQLPSLDVSRATVGEILARNESALGSLLDSALAELKRRPRSTTELMGDHFALYGWPMDARGFQERAGAQVLAAPHSPRRAAAAEWVDDLDFEYRSEEARHAAERVIETSTSSFATVDEAGGAAFVGSGIGAMSLAVRYAQSKAEDRDSFEETGSTDLTVVRTHYHRAPMEQIDFDSLDLRLSRAAERALVAVAHASARARRGKMLEFIRTFGSHVFRQLTLGAWYKQTARATATTKEQRATLRAAVSTAMDLAVFASASYTGLGGQGEASSGTEDHVTMTHGDAREQTYRGMGVTVTVGTSILGGRDGLPLDYWVESVQYPSQWRVIERDRPTPLWEVVARGVAGLTPAQSRDLAGLFERVWVQDWFLPSVAGVDPVLDRVLEDAHIEDVEDLTAALLYVPQTIGRITVSSSSSVFTTSSSGSGEVVFDGKGSRPVTELEVWWDGDKVRGLRWVDAGGREFRGGEVGSDRDHARFELKDETLSSFSVYTTGYGDTHHAVRGLELVTSAGRSLRAGDRTDARTDLTSTVKDRFLMGFHGSAWHGSDYLLSLDPWASPVSDTWPPAPTPPSVRVAGTQVRPPEQPAGQRGFQVIVTDGRLASIPDAVLLDHYFARPYAPDWWEPFESAELYDEILSAVDGGLDRAGNLLVLASFGIDLRACPPVASRISELLERAGSGPGLQAWRAATESTSAGPPGDMTACNYLLAGVFGHESGGRDTFTLDRTATLTYESGRSAVEHLVGSAGADRR